MSGVFETVWLGRGGQGAFTAARLLGLAAVRFAGRQAVAFPSFGPERRGAPVFAYTRVSAAPIHARGAVQRADALVVLDETLLDQVATPFVHDDTLVIIDSPPAVQAPQRRGRVFRIDAGAIARELIGSPHTNTVLLGFFAGLTGLLPATALQAGIEAEFGQGARASRNVLAFLRAHELGDSHRGLAA